MESGRVTLRVSGIVRYDGNGTVYYNYTRIDRGRGMAPRTEIELWSNDTTARRALTNANRTIIDEVRPIRDVPTFAGRMELYLRLFRTDVSGYSRLRGEPIVRVSGSRLDRPGEQFWWLISQLGFREVRDAEFSAEVTEDRLRRYRVDIVGSGESRPGRGDSVILEEELVFTDVGTTTISRPEWVTARNESSSG